MGTETAERIRTDRQQEAADQNEPPLLTPQEQQFVLELVLRGASPAGACRQFGVSVFSFDRTYFEHEGFRKRVDRVNVILSQNVAAALYRAAMEGSVSAQSFWLKSCPPPGWTGSPAELDGPLTFDDFFDQLTDHELLQLARAMGVDMPPEVERTLSGTGGGDLSSGIPS